MKIPIPTKIIRTDIFRDGGSLSVKFLEGDDGVNEYELFLKIDSNKKFNNNIIDFQSVVLNNNYKCNYICPMTGKEISNRKTISINLSWNEAKDIVENITKINFENTFIDVGLIKYISNIISKKCDQ